MEVILGHAARYVNVNPFAVSPRDIRLAVEPALAFCQSEYFILENTACRFKSTPQISPYRKLRVTWPKEMGWRTQRRRRSSSWHWLHWTTCSVWRTWRGNWCASASMLSDRGTWRSPLCCAAFWGMCTRLSWASAIQPGGRWAARCGPCFIACARWRMPATRSRCADQRSPATCSWTCSPRHSPRETHRIASDWSCPFLWDRINGFV